MTTFTYNGLDFAGDLRVNNIAGRGITPSEVSTVRVPGMTGVHAGRKSRRERVIEVEYTVVGTSPEDLRDKINTLSERLDLDTAAPLVFSDEPDKTYFAILISDGEGEDLIRYGKGVLSFLCPDPYKYGEEQTVTLNPDTGTILNIGGTAPTKPIIELTATAPETFAMIINDKDEYNMIGAPVDVDANTYESRTAILSHQMQNMTNWTTANMGETDHPIAGSMASIYDSTDGKHKFKVTDGSGTGYYPSSYHGPAVKTALTEPMDDFTMTSRVKLRNRTSNEQLGNIEVYLLDVNGGIVGRIGLRDGSAQFQNIQAQARLGNAIGEEGETRKTLALSHGERAGVFNDFDGIIRLQRYKQTWTAHFAKIDPETGVHHTRLTEKWTDTHNRFQEPVTQVVVAMQYYGEYPGAEMAFLSINVDRINTREGTPYIVYEGDTVTFDHGGKGKYFLNGEDAKSLKNFGAAPFTLKPGSNILATQPATSFTGTVRWRDAYK